MARLKNADIFIFMTAEFCCFSVLRLLKDGADPNTPIGSGGSLLHLVRNTLFYNTPTVQDLDKSMNL